MKRGIWAVLLFAVVAFMACGSDEYDVVIHNAMIYDGSGAEPFHGSIAIKGDRIAWIGPDTTLPARSQIDAGGLAVAPGFINMLSWAPRALMMDGRSQSDIRQGVTLEVFGEGWSEGPLNEKMRQEILSNQKDFRFDVPWTTLGEFLEHLEERGVSTNIASFVGATTVRINVLGEENRAPNEEELETMRGLVRQAMEEGAMGLASALIYAPGFYADTEELIALAQVVSEYGGMYISHMRSEGNQLLQAIDELITIAREAGVPAEIYHLKAAGRQNWHKLDAAIAKVEKARAEGLRITADMYNYTAGATGLDAAMPPWVQEGGYTMWKQRLQDPMTRQKVLKEMLTPTDEWENLFLASGAENMILVGFRNDSLKHLTGKRLAEVAAERKKSPAETIIDLVIEDGSRVETVYFLMSEENVRKQIAIPWMSFCSDAGSMAPEGLFLRRQPHPRAYGNFARLLGKYVRDEQVIPLQEAIRKLTSQPAGNLGIRDRGMLKEGYFADIVVFDPATIQDHATYDRPHQYATGVQHVFVNGVQVLRDGEHTDARPGRFIRGPGWTGHSGK